MPTRSPRRVATSMPDGREPPAASAIRRPDRLLGAGVARSGGDVAGGGAVVIGAVHRVGVELGDDVLADQSDHLEGGLVGCGAEAEDELVGAGCFPSPALLERVIWVPADEPELAARLDRLRCEVGEQLWPGRDVCRVREGVVVAVDV